MILLLHEVALKGLKVSFYGLGSFCATICPKYVSVIHYYILNLQKFKFFFIKIIINLLNNKSFMKRNLLLLASLFLSIGAFAQWTKPVPETTGFYQGSAENSAYMYNKEAGLFFTEGNAWGTQASVASTGLKVYFSQYIEEGGEWDGQTFLFNDSSVSKKAWKNVFFDNDNGTLVSCFVDRGSQPDYFWNITVADDGSFRLTGSMMNGTFNPESYPDCYFGYDLSTAPATVINGLLDAVNAEDPSMVAVDWAFVTPEAYQVYQEKLAVYNAAVKLADVIVKAENLGIDVSAANAVYGDTSSTLEALQAAYNELNQAIINAASPENPSDATAFIVNPDFTAANLGGWSGTAFGRGGTAADGAEHYDKDFDTYQKIEGLPAGIYRVGVQAFYRAGGIDADATSYKSNDMATRHAKLYATSNPTGEGDVTAEVGIVHISACAQDAPLAGETTTIVAADGTTKYIPNSMLDADSYFNVADLYHNYVFCEVGEDGVLTIGVKKSTHLSTDWAIFDNFSLEFYGNSDAAYKYWAEQVLATTPEVETEEKLYKQSYADEYQQAFETLSNATDKAAIRAAIPQIGPAAQALLANISAYDAYVAAATYADTYLSTHQLVSEATDKLVDYLMGEDGPDDVYPNGCYLYIISECPLTTEEITAETEFVNTMLQEAVKSGIAPGSDCTDMLKNPKFTDAGGAGWNWDLEKNVTVADFNPHGGVYTIDGKEYACAEVYAGWDAIVGGFTFDIWQELTDLQDGVYKLSLNAFYRPADNGAFDGTETSDVELYFNQFSTPVQHIMTDMSENQDYTADVQVTRYDEVTGWIPNDMVGATVAFFQNNRYQQEVYGFVTGGKMRLGFRKTAATTTRRAWCLWSNFTLTYVGNDADALDVIRNSYVEQASTLLENVFGAAEKEALNQAITAVQDAKTVETLSAQLGVLAGAMEAAKVSIESYKNLAAASATLTEALSTYEETAEEAALDAAVALLDKIEGAYASGEYTNEQIAEVINEVNDAITALMRPKGYQDATEDNPVDFSSLIVNGTFDTIGDFHGWSGTVFGAGGTTGPCAEHYNKVYDTYQDIKGLPAGYYVASVQGFYRRGSAENDYAIATSEYPDSALNAFFYTTSFSQYGLATTDSTTIQPIADGADEVGFGGGTIAFGSDKVVPNTMESAVYWFEAGMYNKPSIVTEVGEGGILRIGVKKTAGIEADWSIFDNFQLFYIGTAAPVGIESIDAIEAVTPVGIYNLAGQRINTLQKGINIVNGKKVFVK